MRDYAQVALEGIRLPVPPSAPYALLRLMARCWSEDPSKRPDFSEVLPMIDEVSRLREIQTSPREVHGPAMGSINASEGVQPLIMPGPPAS